MTASMAILHDLEYVMFDVLFVFDVFFLMICSCIGVAVVIVGPSRSIAIHTLMSLCSALLSVNSASWKVDWREGADLTCLVSHFVEEGADQSDVLEALKELQEGGLKEAG